MKRIQSTKQQILIVLFVIFLIRLLLLNVNVTEIGDSYNLLSAGEDLKNFSYPLTEKRLPLLPLLLSFNRIIDPILFGRLLVLALSLLTIYFTVRLYEKMSLQKKYGWLLILLLSTHPLWAFWSLRIMTDVLFGTLLMASMLYYFEQRSWNTRSALILGTLVGLGVLTRFEGLILVFAFGLALLTLRNWRVLIGFVFPVFLLLFPYLLRNYLIFGNPLHTSYAGEVDQSLLSLRLFLVFSSYLIFLSGPLSLCFLRKGIFVLRQGVFLRLLPLLLFLFFYLPLVAIWTAAVPRLFYPLVPFFLIFTVLGFEQAERLSTSEKVRMLLSFLLFVTLAGIFHLDFLAGSLGAMVLVGGLGLLGVGSFWFGSQGRRLFLAVLIFINLVVSTSVIYQARERNATTRFAIEYVLTLTGGPIGFADETGVSSWYLREKGLYWNGDTGYTEALNWMRENRIKYLIVTNEHYEEGAQFHVVYDRKDVDKFRLLQRFERRDGIEPFNILLERLSLRSPKELPVKYTEVYEILSYRSPGD